MSRSYRLSHLSDRSMAEKIRDEVLKMEGVFDIHISEDLARMKIEADFEGLAGIMDRVVNVCKRCCTDCELSYIFPIT